MSEERGERLWLLPYARVDTESPRRGSSPALMQRLSDLPGELEPPQAGRIFSELPSLLPSAGGKEARFALWTIPALQHLPSRRAAC